jgi:hypothetical protein
LDPRLQIHSKFYFILFLKKKQFNHFIMYSGKRETAITGHSVWAQDAHIIMQDVSQLKLIAMSLLQTCSYVTEQMQTPVTIDVNKFMESFSIKAEEGADIHPPFWIKGEGDLVTFSSGTAEVPNSQSSSPTLSQEPFTMPKYSQCRQAEDIRWTNLRERRSSVIPRLQPITPEEYQAHRDAIYAESGSLHRKGIKFHFLPSSCGLSIHYIFTQPKRGRLKFKNPKPTAIP